MQITLMLVGGALLGLVSAMPAGNAEGVGAPSPARAAKMAVALDAIDAALATERLKALDIAGSSRAVAFLVEHSSVHGGPNPAQCSIGTALACSTTQGTSGEKTCSVLEADGQSASAACSVLSGDNETANAFCSVESGSREFCSVQAKGIAEQSDCSVKSTGDENFCSVSSTADNSDYKDTICSVIGKDADRGGAECSVFGGPGTERFCSVHANSSKDHTCTTFDETEKPENESRCSSHDVAAGNDLCSLITGEPPSVQEPQNGVCVANRPQ